MCIISRLPPMVCLARDIRPSAVVLDMRLPDQSGLYVLDQLKRTAATRHIPVHIVSVADYVHLARRIRRDRV